jgi:hypothetical protein
MWPKGTPLREEMKRKLRGARLGKPLPARTRDRMREAHRASLVLAADRVGRKERRRG